MLNLLSAPVIAQAQEGPIKTPAITDVGAFAPIEAIPGGEERPLPTARDPARRLSRIRADLATRKIEPVFPGRSNRRVTIEYDRALYKQRNRIERMFGHLKINRAIATRYNQTAKSSLGIVHLSTAGYWLKFVHAA